MNVLNNENNPVHKPNYPFISVLIGNSGMVGWFTGSKTVICNISKAYDHVISSVESDIEVRFWILRNQGNDVLPDFDFFGCFTETSDQPHVWSLKIGYIRCVFKHDRHIRDRPKSFSTNGVFEDFFTVGYSRNDLWIRLKNKKIRIW